MIANLSHGLSSSPLAAVVIWVSTGGGTLGAATVGLAGLEDPPIPTGSCSELDSHSLPESPLNNKLNVKYYM